MKDLMVPLDGSPAAEAALDLAVALVRLSGGRIHIVHVSTPVGSEPMGVERSAVQPWCEKYLGALVTRLKVDEGLDVEATILDGDLVHGLLAHARAVAADLVVMTTHGWGTTSRFWLGSVTDRYLRVAEQPVLLLRPEQGQLLSADGSLSIHRVVVPLDGSEASESAVDVASSIADLTRAELGLLRVVELPVPAHLPSDSDVAVSDSVSMTRAKEHLGSVAERVPSGIARSEVRVHLEPAVAILDLVSDWDADLVVMSTRGLGVARRVFLGSVTDKVVRGATTPVLVVPCEDG